jgi:uncharacterized protein DUF1207
VVSAGALGILALAWRPLWATEEAASCHQGYPETHELFAPFLANTREPQSGFRYEMPVSHTPKLEVALGDDYGLYRWCLGQDGDQGRLQLNVGAAVFADFDYHDTKDLLSSDFYGRVPIEYRLGRWSDRLLFFHISSHLGDDLIRTTGQVNGTREWNAIQNLISYDLSAYSRLYGGGLYTIASKTSDNSTDYTPFGAQGGFEVYSKPFHQNRLQLYWANDCETFALIGWNPIFTSQLGLKTARDLSHTRSVSYFLEFFSGHKFIGQFYPQKETHWDFGVKFQFS